MPKFKKISIAVFIISSIMCIILVWLVPQIISRLFDIQLADAIIIGIAAEVIFLCGLILGRLVDYLDVPVHPNVPR